ncbi:site-specific DNA-methyltransferase [Stomatobaculum longum]|uniref:site-specific DNA-methyltransferase n=1 Tax=Stomatobaculum longum TaxID=796942 RepID=UPI0028E99AE2|nr:site-specific DNA-methyltransferase [Stomatobaculum longum]
MEKMRMESPDIAAQNIDKVAELFPSCITEALDEEHSTPDHKVYKKVVNFDMLRQILSGDVLEGDEAYEFSWVGKKAAVIETYKRIRKTLRPIPEASVSWDTTQNIYIEGDNLEVLKLLQESYLGSIRVIYIDPPYNTGNDFLYRDDFSQTLQSYEEETGVFDEDDLRLYRNTNANGRFHSDWCSMMYSRLSLARNLLTDDGAIFVSIDEHELSDLLSMMNEIFGEENFIDAIVWDKKASAKGVPPRNMMVNVHEYIVAYSKNGTFRFIGERRTAESGGFKNPDNDPRGPWRMSNIKSTTKPIEEAFTIVDPNTGKEYTNTWAFSRESLEQMIKEDRILWKETLPKQKEFLYEMTNENMAIKSNWGVFDAQSTTVFLKNLIPQVHFDNPKPINLMKYLISVAMRDGDTVLDFFSGSGTTAHAVMQINAEDNGNRKFIMVQIPEPCDEKTEAYKAGFKSICDIGEERIRRVGKQIKEESPLTTGSLDTGFRVFRVDESNMNDVYYFAGEYKQDMLSMLESNVKSDRTDLDLLFGCLLDWGLPLSMPYTSEQIEGCTVHTYNDGDLIACFDENIPDSVIKEIAKRQPLRAVFRDSSFDGSPAKINVGEIFKMLAPDTRVKVI